MFTTSQRINELENGPSSDFKGSSSFKPNLSQHQNPRDLSQKIAFLVDMNSDHFRVHLCVGLYFLLAFRYWPRAKLFSRMFNLYR